MRPPAATDPSQSEVMEPDPCEAELGSLELGKRLFSEAKLDVSLGQSDLVGGIPAHGGVVEMR